ncbi:cytochrome c oxidase subunit 1, partial [Haplosporangium sp. Z 27]
RRLGGLYRLFQAAILIYIATSIIYQQRYLKTENIINGAVRVTLKAPSDGISTPSYCNPASQPCIYWNENDILYEPSVDGALITTRAQITEYGPFNNQSDSQKSICNVNIPTVGCDPYSAPSTLLLPTSVVADIERFTLMLEHSIRGQATGIQIRSGNMVSGLLRDSESGDVLQTFTDETRYVSDNSGDSTKVVHLAGDVMTVGEFLKASGVNLDDLSLAPTATPGETVRTSGVVVIVVIQYAAKGWNPNRISYEYLPKAIPDQEYKVIETIRDFKNGNRVEINRHGVRIVFSQAGQLGQFSLMTLLTNLVAAVALFKVANIIVELMMLRLHPQKKIFVRSKFEGPKDDRIFGKDSENPKHHANSGKDIASPQDDMEQGAADHPKKQIEHPGRQSNGNNSHPDPYHSESSSDESDSHEVVMTEAEGDAEFRGVSASGSLSHRGVGPYSRYNVDQRFDSTSRTSATNWGRVGPRSTSVLGSVGASAYHAALNYSAGSLDDEIETRFGPVRPAEYKGFNPGGLEIDGSQHLATLKNTGYNCTLGMSTPQNQTSKGSRFLKAKDNSPSLSLSPTTMQAASPNPVCFGSQQDNSSSSVVRERRRSGKQTSSKQDKRQEINSSTSRRRSVRSVFTITPSSSSSSLTSFEGSPYNSKDNRAMGSTMSLGLGPGLTSSSTWSFGAPESGYSSGGDSITGFELASDRSKSPAIDSTKKREQKKRRKESHPALVSANQLTPTSPMFELGVSGNMSTFSLSLFGQMEADPKGKQPDQSYLKKASAFEGQVIAGVGSSSMDQTTIYNASLESFQLPLPAYLSQGSGSLLDFDKILHHTKVTESATSSHIKQPLRHSVSSPCLLSTYDSTSSVDATYPTSTPLNQEFVITEGYPEYYTMASVDLPPRSSDWRFLEEESTTTTTASALVNESHVGEIVESSEYNSQNPSRGFQGNAQVSGTHPRCEEMPAESSTHTTCRSSEPGLHHGSVSHFTTSTSVPSTAEMATSRDSTTAMIQIRPITSIIASEQSNSTPIAATISYTSILNNGSNYTPINLNLNNASTSSYAGHPSNTFYTTATANTSYSTNNYDPYPTNSFFRSPITSGYTTTLAGTGVRVLGRSITMIMDDETELVLRRSEPLILNEGVGEEKAARM